MDDVSGKFVLVVLRGDHVRVHHKRTKVVAAKTGMFSGSERDAMSWPRRISESSVRGKLCCSVEPVRNEAHHRFSIGRRRDAGEVCFIVRIEGFRHTI